MQYSGANHCYTLKMDSFLTNSELLAITKVLIGSRAFDKEHLTAIIDKLKSNTTASDKERLGHFIIKEMMHYTAVGSDCDNVIDNVWKLTECIENHNDISITYNKMSREQVKRRIRPLSIMFSEYYFYLIAYRCDGHDDTPIYFRIDRIVDIIVHRTQFETGYGKDFDEGLLRRKSQFMWPGPARRIRFEFSGPSVQAILDRLPTARIISSDGSIYIIEADVYGDGIMMFLLSQGSWVKVLAPESFVVQMRNEISKMAAYYKEPD